MTPITAVVTWRDTDGNAYEWPHATKDNRRSRVLARIHRYAIPCDESTVVIRRVVTP